MIFLDLETTGLDSVKHGILSIGAVDTERTKDYYFYQEPRLEKHKEIDPKALEINGFTEHGARDPSKRRVRDVLRQFIVWSRDCKVMTLAGQNPNFDANFIKEVAKRYDIEWPFGIRYIDLYTTAVNAYLREGIKMPMRKGRYEVNLDAILWSVGLERHNIHHALEDAMIEAEAYFRLETREGKYSSFGNFSGKIKNFDDYKPQVKR